MFSKRSVFVAVSLALAGAAQAQISDGVVKIGVLSDMSSLYSDIGGGGSAVAARMAIADFPKNGMKVELLSADHLNKPDVGSSIARQWYDVDKVDVIVDVPTSSVALAISQITREKGKAFLVSGAASSDLTGKACSPNTIHWTYDTWMLANGTGNAIVKTGGDSWYFITADYAFGLALERDTEAVVLKNGGKVLGKVRHPLNTQDFSSFLLQAQASKAKIIGLANAGGDSSGADFHRDLLLGSERSDAGVRQALRLRERRQVPDHGPGRCVFGDHALSQGGRGAEGRRRHQGDRQDEGAAHRRPALRQGPSARRRPQAPSRVSGGSEEALGIEGPVRLLQDSRDDSGGPGVPADGSGRLPAGREEIAFSVIPA